MVVTLVNFIMNTLVIYYMNFEQKYVTGYYSYRCIDVHMTCDLCTVYVYVQIRPSREFTPMCYMLLSNI